MKKLLFSTILMTAIAGNTLADSTFEHATLKLCLKNIQAVKTLSDQQCQSQLQPCYTFHSKDKTLKLNNTMNLSFKHIKLKTDKKGITQIKGYGIWSGAKSPTNGKPFEDKTFFNAVGFTKAGVVKGVFTDSVCRGEFELGLVK